MSQKAGKGSKSSLPRCMLNTARFVPPPPDCLAKSLGELEKFLHHRQLPPRVFMLRSTIINLRQFTSFWMVMGDWVVYSLFCC